MGLIAMACGSYQFPSPNRNKVIRVKITFRWL